MATSNKLTDERLKEIAALPVTCDDDIPEFSDSDLKDFAPAHPEYFKVTPIEKNTFISGYKKTGKFTMKRIYLFLFIFCINSFLFSLDKKTYAGSIDQWIDITETDITFNYCDPFDYEGVNSYEYETERKNELDWLIIKKDGKEKKLLSLHNDEWLILYADNCKEPVFTGYSSFKGLELIDYVNPKSVTASSELKEKNQIYYGSNVSSLNLNSPWAESASDYGIGEHLQLKANGRFIYLFNGYVSYNKPYLYSHNSRIRRIKISFSDGMTKPPMTFEIEDTPNPQKLDLGETVRDKIKIEIVDVYPGTKYKDTCLNGMIFKVF